MATVKVKGQGTRQKPWVLSRSSMISALSHDDDIRIVQDFLTGTDEAILKEILESGR
ncbi:MAG: hypothetical protein ACREJA_00790 [Candidatus Methylomirabilales bacterium]